MTRALSRRELAALGLILAAAATLRIVGSGYGLPFPLLNADEASIVPRAWRIGHLETLDPGWYDYPSLLMYLLAPVQGLVAAPSYGAARIVAVALGLAGVAASWWLGRRAYGPGAGLIAAAAVAVATVHVAYSRMAVTDVAVTLGITAALALALADRLEWAGVAAGLAASAKYPGAVVAVPLLVAGWGQWRRLITAAALAALAFVLTSPFIVIHAGAAWDDFSRVQRLARAGWLGFEHDHSTPVAFADRLWEALGPFLLVAAVGLVAALVRRSRADLVLASFVLAYALYLMPLEAHFDRYVLPLIPVLGVFGGLIRPLRPLAALLLVVPLVWAIGDARELTRTDTRARAAAWIDAHVPRQAVLAADPGTLPLEHRRVVRLELPGPGRPSDPRRSIAALRAAGARWLLVSGAVTDRVLAAREDYPAESAFYEALARRRPSYELLPGRAGLAGPWVRVYRL
jgi:4-amino-4-deoxy-L-arabinose transferase-like glycosyltransferase